MRKINTVESNLPRSHQEVRVVCYPSFILRLVDDVYLEAERQSMVEDCFKEMVLVSDDDKRAV